MQMGLCNKLVESFQCTSKYKFHQNQLKNCGDKMCRRTINSRHVLILYTLLQDACKQIGEERIILKRNL
jgi:hypothetical protein